MKLVIFGLSITSSWGNGHATLWRGLLAALRGAAMGRVLRAQRVVVCRQPRSAAQPGCEIVLYDDWAGIGPGGAATCARPRPRSSPPTAGRRRRRASWWPTRRAAGGCSRPRHAGDAGRGRARRAPALAAGARARRFRPRAQLHGRRGPRRAAAPAGGAPRPAALRRRPGRAPAGGGSAAIPGHLSYIGTWAADRQPALERLLVSPARLLPEHHFVIAGAQYRRTFPGPPTSGSSATCCRRHPRSTPPRAPP